MKHNESKLQIRNALWRPIVGYEQTYEVHISGNIRSVTRFVRANKSGGLKKVLGKPRKICVNTKRWGYCYVNLKGKNALQHRIVWTTFNGTIPCGLEINHIDGNKQNNALFNLELVTSSQNKIHAYQSGLKKESRYSDNNKSKKISSIDTEGNKVIYDSIARAVDMGFRKSSIIAVLKCRQKQHKNLTWRYET